MKKVIWIALALVGIAFAYLMSQGLYRSVEVQTGEQGGMLLVGLDHTGPYYSIGDVFESLRSDAGDAEFVGVYFDNPDLVPEDSCRSFAGWIVPSTAAGLEAMGRNHKLRMLPIERRPSTYCDWEGSGMVGILLGTFKAYPALGEVAAQQGWSGEDVIAYEHYTDGSTRFVMQY